MVVWVGRLDGVAWRESFSEVAVCAVFNGLGRRLQGGSVFVTGCEYGCELRMRREDSFEAGNQIK